MLWIYCIRMIFIVGYGWIIVKMKIFEYINKYVK